MYATENIQKIIFYAIWKQALYLKVTLSKLPIGFQGKSPALWSKMEDDSAPFLSGLNSPQLGTIKTDE